MLIFPSRRFKRFVVVPEEPIWIASSVDIGSKRARANHLDAVLDFFQEQKELKQVGAPIPDCRPQTKITYG